MSIRDSMTSLLNHKNFFFRLNQEIEKAKRINYPLSILLMDIDEFKNINDQYGHLVGDEVIVKLAKTLTDTCRTTDVIARYGGDEFVIIMLDTESNEVMILVERIWKTIESTEFPLGIHITVSGGIGGFHGQSAEELIREADVLLYKAKSNGRNRFEKAVSGL